MVLKHSTVLALLLSSLAVEAQLQILDPLLNPDSVCHEIGAALSGASSVYGAVDLTGRYSKGIEHWASSSSQLSACTVEPGTAQDVGVALNVLAARKMPFAVKGGGHTMNPGFSSTEGVHITLARFDDVIYDSSSQTVAVGAGLTWDEVYETLDPLGVTVIGGRVTGVGVAGFSLGGGYSWKTNQYGLTVDNILAYELVKPDGTVATVTEASDADLFWSLKGGFNNFGVVTKFTFRAHSQGQVWGGTRLHDSLKLANIANATHTFANTVNDPKAAIITTINYLAVDRGVSQLLFYDGPTPPAGIFDEFMAVPALSNDVSTRSYPSLVGSAPGELLAGQRGVFHSVMFTEWTPTIIAAVLNESEFWGPRLTAKSGSFISYQIEPFLPRHLTQGTASSAWPPNRSTNYQPLNLYYAWTNPLFDQVFYDAIKASVAHLKSVAVAEGQPVQNAPIYPNYAHYDTPLADMYGSNLQRLRQTKQVVDPGKVMELTGGFKF